MSLQERFVVWLDGRLVDPEKATIHWADHGLTVGDGVFETIELRRGQPFALTRHLARLRRSAAGLGIPCPDDETLRGAVDDVAGSWGTTAGRLRVTLTSGVGPIGSGRAVDTEPTLLVTASRGSVRVEPTAVITVPFTRNERGALVGLKTTSYAENVVALALAEQDGASEALFANTVGNLCEGTGANVFVSFDDTLVTPPLESGCLAGITRELLLEALDRAGVPAIVRDVSMDELDDAQEMFLVSTVRHVQPVSHVDRRALPSCPGPLTVAASEIWHAAYDDVLDP